MKQLYFNHRLTVSIIRTYTPMTVLIGMGIPETVIRSHDLGSVVRLELIKFGVNSMGLKSDEVVQIFRNTFTNKWNKAIHESEYGVIYL